MNKFTKTLVAASVIGAVSMPAVAAKHRHYDDYNQSSVDYAKVTRVQPVYETVQVNQPVEECWDEQVHYDNHRSQRRHKSFTPEILGAVIGAAVGNRVGSRSSERKAATAIGAVLGTTIARDIKHQNRHNQHDSRYGSRHSSRHSSQGSSQRYDVVQRCEVRDNYVDQNRLVAYDVEYKYRGNVFHTRTGEHPGDRIRVKVSVDPV